MIPTAKIPTMNSMMKMVPSVRRRELSEFSIPRLEKLAPTDTSSRMPNRGSMIRPVARNSCFNNFLSI